MTLRMRFAPSPSGYLHIGNVRSTLFTWLWCKSQGGTFVLRVEDTDQERSSLDSVRAVPGRPEVARPANGTRAPRWKGRSHRIFRASASRSTARTPSS